MSTIFGMLLLSLPTYTQPPSDNPVELGRVQWQRNLDAALKESQNSGKPVFALFQEIPGCATCRSFGSGPLSHPLLVEAIEDLFVPLAIFNNRKGEDAEALARYSEPSWNNPVVRFLDADGKDLIPRKDRVWNTTGIAERAVQALAESDRDVPRWLSVVAAEAEPSALSTATFAMHCFWEGEVRLGALEGVATTRAGWVEGSEVVEVKYDPERIDYSRLVKEAQLGGARAVKSSQPARDAKDADQDFHLRRSPMKLLPLTPMQRTKINSALGSGEDGRRWLSPRQRVLLTRIEGAHERSPKLLEDLVPPSSIDGLDTYERELTARLSAR